MNGLNDFVLHPYVMGVCAGVKAGLCEGGFAGLGGNTVRRVCELAGVNDINYLSDLVSSDIVESGMEEYLRSDCAVRGRLLDGILSVQNIGVGDVESENNSMSEELYNLTAFYGLMPVSL